MEQEKKYLSDFLLAIDLIEQFTESINDYDTFLTDLKTQSAVERQLGIIGEAVNKYGKITTAGPIENAVKIVGFRNRLIHVYDAIDPSIIWTIIKRHLNPLKEEIIIKMEASRQ
jgi:uncharacterized protein with HEPN domain